MIDVRTLVMSLALATSCFSVKAQPLKKTQIQPDPISADAVDNSGAVFTANEISLLYEACQQFGGSVTMRGSEFSCRKMKKSTSNLDQKSSVTSTPLSALPDRKDKYTGASLADTNVGLSSGDISKARTVTQIVPLIRVGVTTRAEIVAALKEPLSSQFDSTGRETTIFLEKVGFMKSGGVGQLFTKKVQLISSFL